MDVYKMEFLNCRMKKGNDGLPTKFVRDVLETREDVYDDNLQEVFTRVTGLDTHL
jgi:hypothetical protein